MCLNQFGLGYGFLQGVLSAYDCEVRLVTPQEWMKALGMGTTGKRSKEEWKRHLKSEAQRLYPEQKVTLCTADALLIWTYAKAQVLGGAECRG